MRCPLLTKESKMPVISREKDELNAIAENAEVALNQVAGNRARGELTGPALQNISSLPSGREEKVLAVRQQLDEGTYDLDERETAVLDRLLENLTT
jgi:anti-sigma28 factor (negative regulator of flagellin synthesis)